MGWMSWQAFRCGIDCETYPDSCISEGLYRAQADALVSSGLLAAGYNTIHLDDCIVEKARDAGGRLVSDQARFPSGFRALGDYLHARNVSFGFYTAISGVTCGGYPGSRGYEAVDAASFSEWTVDYLKADGCGDPAYYPIGYPAMGAALRATDREIAYSCSWPAYLGDDETRKPFASFVAAGCNVWRNFIDVGPTAGYLQGILEHFGNYSSWLAEWTMPLHASDADMLLAGVEGVSEDLARSQHALFCILALPLIMGNDLRRLSAAALATLTSPGALAISQDAAVRAGVRLGGAAAANAPQQVWARPLANGDVAVALYNAGPPPAHAWHTACAPFNATAGGYFASRGAPPAGWCSPALGQSLLDWYCCNTEDCAGYYFNSSSGQGCMLKDLEGGFVAAGSDVTGYTKADFSPPSGAAADVSWPGKQLLHWRGGGGLCPRFNPAPAFPALPPTHTHTRRSPFPLQTWGSLLAGRARCACTACTRTLRWPPPMRRLLPCQASPGRARCCCASRRCSSSERRVAT